MIGLKIENIKLRKKVFTLFLTSTLALNSSFLLNNAHSRAEATASEYRMQNDYVETISSVNMRTDSNLYSDIICKIEESEQLRRILSCDNNWDLVMYKDKLGFVCRDYVNDISESVDDLEITSEDGYVFATTGINLRIGPSTDDKIIGGLKTDDMAKVLGKTNDNWYLVSYNGQIGYVSEEYVSYKENVNFNNNQDGKLYGYSSANVNFREEPTIYSEKIDLIGKGTKFEVLAQEDNGWFKIVYEDNIGYISDEYITFDAEGEYRSDFIKVVYANEELELRNEQSQDSFLLYTMDRYETCEVLAETEEQYFVRCAGKIGYISKWKTTDLYNTFVVVDISAQKLTLYRNNDILLETNIVSGKKDVYDTPTGMYSIKKKETDTFLSGEDYYVHIDYWMPFNGGIGLHDADWRSSFGGSIYEKNGSHGCINIPEEYTDDIYDNIEQGTRVIVQK